MNNEGLTLIELMIVIAIISILAAMAAPSFNSILRRHQVSAETDVLFALIHLARTEAIKRNSVVTICKSNDADQCGGTWTDGWIVFQDNDKDGSRDIGDTLIASGSIGKGYLLKWTAFGSNNYIRFTPRTLTLAQNGTFRLCPYDGDIHFARAVVISKTARVRLPKDSDGDGIYDDASGDPIKCS